jgi:hypothetical protein
MEESGFSSEDLLQRLLADYPDLLAGEQVDPEAPRRWLLVTREFGVPDAEGAAERWSLDHLFLDQDGIPTLVEVKRSSDTRIRREVVGQMLDYAANAVVYWPIETVRARLETTCSASGVDPAEAVSRLLDRPETDEAAVAEFWERVKTNLQAGRVRLVFVADEIPSELRRVVEFLNGQMDPAEVLAVEIRQYVGGEMQTLVPRVLGQTAAAQQKKASSSAPRRRWDEPTFFASLEDQSGRDAVVAGRELYAWAQRAFDRVGWGSGAINGSMQPVVEYPGGGAVPFILYTEGSVEIAFQFLRQKRYFGELEHRRELLRRLNAIPGVAIPEDRLDRRPSFPVSRLVDGARRRAFQEVMEWVVEQLRAGDRD